MGTAFFFVICLILTSFFGCSSPEQRATKLFSKASELVREAREVEESDYSDAFRLYRDALAKVERIISEYPSTELGLKLANDQSSIGPHTYSELRRTILPRAEARAEAEESPLACALFIARAMEEVETFGHLADEGVDTEAKRKASQVLFEVLHVAETKGGTEFKTWLLLRISSAYAEYGQQASEKGEQFLHELVRSID